MVNATTKKTAHIRISGQNLSALIQLQSRKKKQGLGVHLSQLANQAIALGLKAAKEHAP